MIQLIVHIVSINSRTGFPILVLKTWTSISNFSSSNQLNPIAAIFCLLPVFPPRVLSPILPSVLFHGHHNITTWTDLLYMRVPLVKVWQLQEGDGRRAPVLVYANTVWL